MLRFPFSNANTAVSGSNIFFFDYIFQIQHPWSWLNRFDLVITPHHDYYPLASYAQKQIPWFLHRWITPREPPYGHVVHISIVKYSLRRDLDRGKSLVAIKF